MFVEQNFTLYFVQSFAALLLCQLSPTIEERTGHLKHYETKAGLRQ